MKSEIAIVEQCVVYYVTKKRAKSAVNFKPWLKAKREKPNLDRISELKISIRNITFPGLEKIKIPEEKHPLFLLLIQTQLGELVKIKERISKNIPLNCIPKFILINNNDYKKVKDFGNLSGGIILNRDKINPNNLGYMCYITLLNIYYHQAINKLADRLDTTTHIMDSVFELARTELKDATETRHAFERILEFETQVREIERSSRLAYEQLSQFRDKELYALRQQLDAEERLRNFHRAQKKSFLEIQQATNRLLEYSQRENVEKQKFVEAQEQLRILTEQEIRTLHEENNILKEKIQNLETGGKKG
jgi:hypothetical protein